MFSLVGNYAGQEREREVWRGVSIMIFLLLSQKLWAIIWQWGLNLGFVGK